MINTRSFFCCVFGALDKSIGFAVFSELRTKKTVEILCFRDFVVLGQKKQCFLVCFCVFGAGDKKNIGFTVFSEPGTKKQWFYCVF